MESPVNNRREALIGYAQGAYLINKKVLELLICEHKFNSAAYYYKLVMWFTWLECWKLAVICLERHKWTKREKLSKYQNGVVCVNITDISENVIWMFVSNILIFIHKLKYECLLQTSHHTKGQNDKILMYLLHIKRKLLSLRFYLEWHHSDSSITFWECLKLTGDKSRNLPWAGEFWKRLHLNTGGKKARSSWNLKF